MIAKLSASKLRKRLVIVGNGLATGRLLDELCARNTLGKFEVFVFGEETSGCYNRVQLSRVLSGAAPSEIMLKDADWYAHHGIVFHAGARVLRLDLAERRVIGSRGVVQPFDALVLATGSRAVVPTLPGLHNDDRLLDGAFVFRTLDDCEAILGSVVPDQPAVVLGGGLLGLEAAKGLADLGMRVTVLERSSGPMSRQLDLAGQTVLSQHLQRLGIGCVGGVGVQSVYGTERVEGVRLTDGSDVACKLLVMACGIQPRTELARSAGLPVKKALLVNEWLSVEGTPHVHGIGECVEIDGELFGTVAPIWAQAEVLADVLSEVARERGYHPTSTYTKLKVAGIDVASFGDTGENFAGELVTVTEPNRGLYVRLRIDQERLVGAQLVGDSRLAARLLQYHDQRIPVPEHRLDLLASEAAVLEDGCASREVCNCHHVSEEAIVGVIGRGALDLASVALATRAGTGCGSCHSAVSSLIRQHAPQPKATAA